MDEILKRDQNFVTVLAGVTNDSDLDIEMLRVDPISKRLLIAATISGSVVTSLNGLIGAVTLAAGTNITLGQVGQTITINATGGGSSPGGNINDLQLNNGSGGFAGSDNLKFSGGFLTINGDSSYGQINLTDSANTTSYGGLGINGANDQIIIGALKGDLSIWNGQDINFSADAGSTDMMTLTTDGNFIETGRQAFGTGGNLNAGGSTQMFNMDLNNSLSANFGSGAVINTYVDFFTDSVYTNTDTPGMGSGVSAYGAQFEPATAGPGDFGNLTGMTTSAVNGGTGTLTLLYGGQFSAFSVGDGTTVIAIGGSFNVGNFANVTGSTILNATGGEFVVQTDSMCTTGETQAGKFTNNVFSGTVTGNAAGINIFVNGDDGGTIGGNYYGAYVHAIPPIGSGNVAVTGSVCAYVSDPGAGNWGVNTITPTNTLTVDGTANITSLTSTRIPIAGTAGLLTDTADLTFSTATPALTFGGGIVKLTKTVTGASTASNFLNVTGTLNSTNSAIARAVDFEITSAGTSAFAQNGFTLNLLAGYTGSAVTRGIQITNSAAGTGVLGWTGGAANYGATINAGATTAGNNIGNNSSASGSSSMNVGLYGRGVLGTNSPALNIGVAGQGLNGTVSIGGAFMLMNVAPTFGTTTALLADNGAVAADIFQARDNGTVVFTVADGGTVNVSTLTASRVVQTDGSKNLQSSSVTATELGYVSGVTSAVQTQLNARTYYSGSFSGVGTATTTFTVTIGTTQANTTYKVNATPTNLLSTAVFYINNKTTTTFDVVYLAGLTGTVTFDWSLFP